MKTQLRLQLQCGDVLFTFVQVHIWVFLQLKALLYPSVYYTSSPQLRCNFFFFSFFFIPQTTILPIIMFYISLCTCLPRTQQCSVRNETKKKPQKKMVYTIILL